MPKANPKQQQMSAGAAFCDKEGERDKSSLKGASRGLYESMREEDLRIG